MLLVSVFACKSISSSMTYPLAFYEIEAAGTSPQLKVRLFSDYSSIVPNQEFNLCFFFKLKHKWYTYTPDTDKDNIPTEIKIRLPDDFEIIEEKWPEPIISTAKIENSTEKIYDEDFKVIYTIKAPENLPDNVLITASASWQVCKLSLCTLGAAQLSCELLTEKKIKSKLYNFIK